MTFLDTVLTRVDERAVVIDWRRVFLLVLLALPLALGWSLRLTLRWSGWLLSYAVAAFVEGWQAGAPRQGG